jgi:shikimate kinase
MDRKELGEVMETIFLIGFMGSGKTSVGRELSKRLNIPVFDTDEEIIRSTRRSITEIFEVEGEPFFRALELETLRVLTIPNSIITTGGGIVLREENRKWMKENGVVIYLDVTPEATLKRLKGDQTRPLLQSDKEVKVPKLLNERMPLYLEAANMIIETTDKTVETIVSELIQRLKNV